MLVGAWCDLLLGLKEECNAALEAKLRATKDDAAEEHLDKCAIWFIVEGLALSFEVGEGATKFMLIPFLGVSKSEAAVVQMDLGVTQLDASVTQVELGATHLDAGVTHVELGAVHLEIIAAHLEVGAAQVEVGWECDMQLKLTFFRRWSRCYIILNLLVIWSYIMHSRCYIILNLII